MSAVPGGPILEDGHSPSRRHDRSRNAEQVLGADLWTLVSRRESALADFSVITRRPSARLFHASYRLVFADGQILKGRQIENEEAARRLLDIRRRIDAPYLPDIVAAHGSAFLESWIDGRPLLDLPRDADHVRRCGAILRRLHMSLAVENGADKRREQAAARRNVVLQQIDELRQRDAIDPRCALRLRLLVDAFAPEECALGLAHIDFCAENIVVADGGEPFVVDNETLSIDALAFDLARVWYRWRMSKSERQAFLEGYGTRASSHEFEVGFPFWVIAATANGACFRLRHDIADAATPIRILERLAGSRWSGASSAAPRPLDGKRCYGSFRCGDFSVGVTVQAPDDLEWLEEFLTPQFEPGADTAPHFDITATADADAVRALAESIPPRPGDEIDSFVLDGGAIRADRWLDLDDCRLVYDDNIRAVYRVDRLVPKVWLTYDPTRIGWRIGLMRLIRELVMRQRCRLGGVLVHGAALSHADRGILIVGPKMAGKTTLLTFCLQHSAARYVSNDRVALDRDGSGAIEIQGIPTIVSIRSVTTALLPWLRDRQQRLEFRQNLTIAEAAQMPVRENLRQKMIESPNITPGQYCALVGTDSTPTAPLSTIVFPRYEEDAGVLDGADYRVRRLDPGDASQRLRESLFGPANLMPGGALLNLDEMARTRAQPSDREILAITSSTQCLECLLGPHVYQRVDPLSLLSDLR